MKETIDLRDVAAFYGFAEDFRASDSHHAVMRHPSGQKVIIGVAASGHWVFSSNQDARGSVVDFLAWHQKMSVGEAIRALRQDIPPADKRGR